MKTQIPRNNCILYFCLLKDEKKCRDMIRRVVSVRFTMGRIGHKEGRWKKGHKKGGERSKSLLLECSSLLQDKDLIVSRHCTGIMTFLTRIFKTYTFILKRTRNFDNNLLLNPKETSMAFNLSYNSRINNRK